MSKAKTPEKVLRIAIRRVELRWGKGHWINKVGNVYQVCIEGAITGGLDKPTTEAQRVALKLTYEAVLELHPGGSLTRGGWLSIPSFNDAPSTTKDMALKVLKLALIKAETEKAIKSMPNVA